MAHALLPSVAYKAVDTSKMCSTNVAKSTLSDVLQSDSVKRLFSQPNIVIKTFPLKIKKATSVSNNNIPFDKEDGLNANLIKPIIPAVTIVPTTLLEEKHKEDLNRLPLKLEGMSEISILPVKPDRKTCGHDEQCENIICDVTVQQYVDHEGAFPMLATNIDESEINAPVSTHCQNENCDALSIDHDRCRRVSIKLYRFDQTRACDICGVTLKTRKSRVHHKKNCTRKDEYRHNETNGAQIMKERMREREIQMMEASKAKKNDYLDPVTGHSLAMETLRNNEELIIIPKSNPAQHPTFTVTSVPATQSIAQLTRTKNGYGKLVPSIPITPPQPRILFAKPPASNENDSSSPKPVNLPGPVNNSFLTTSNVITLPQNQYIRILPQNTVQPVTLNDLLLSPSQIVTTTPLQPKSFLTPFRVVPITNLISQPSLLHQTQGIPKFCIMADNTTSSSTTVKVNPEPVEKVAKDLPTLVPNIVDQVDSKLKVLRRKRKVTIKKEGKHKKKQFKCNYCFKCFSTDWYFKMHVAMHEGEKRFSCTACTKSFTNRYDLKRHVTTDHKNEGSKPHAARSKKRLYKCPDCNKSYTSAAFLKHHRRKFHKRLKCRYCRREFLDHDLSGHVALAHSLSGKNAKSAVTNHKNGHISDELTKTVVPSILKKTRKKSLHKLQETEATDEGSNEKLNGLISIPTENSVKDVELNHNV